jgi:beta-lactamase regulating signal transducer with metallopeptidase domain
MPAPISPSDANSVSTRSVSGVTATAALNLILAVVYLAGFLFFAARFALGWYLAATLIQRARQRDVLALDGATKVFESPEITVPMTMGVVRPVIVLPVEWRHWDTETLAAVLSHEAAHIRRHDPAVAFVARLNRTIFWFHPLAWWLERTVRATAEHTCDEAAAQTIGSANRYAEILLTMAGIASHRGSRLEWQAVGVYGSGGLEGRLKRLISDEPVVATSRRKRIVAGIACAFGIAVAVSCRQPAPVTPLREDPERTRLMAAQAAATKRFEEARDLTQEQADALEQQLVISPDDADTRWMLATYYRASRNVAWDKKVPGLRRHSLWWIEHHPEDGVAPPLVPQHDPEGFAAARKLWEAHLAKPAASALLIARAVSFFSQTDKAYAEQLIGRGLSEDPDSKALAASIGPDVGGYQWRAQLANLYASALTGTEVGFHVPPVPDSYTRHVREVLDTTNDAGLLANVGTMLVWLTPWSRDKAAYSDIRMLGVRYLERALELDPSHEQAKAALMRERVATQRNDADRLASRAEERFMVSEDITEYARKDPARAKQQREDARRDAEEVLKIAAGHAQDAEYAAAVMTAHHVLAALALRDGDREKAIGHLQESVKVPASERIQYLPPMSWMRPANRLLKLGERERVAQFYEALAKLTITERARLLDDARAIREGRMTLSYQASMARSSD